MIKYTKTAEDVRIEADDLKNDPTLKFLRDMNHFKFNVGDVLIREDRVTTSTMGDHWVVKKASCGLPYRYAYVFENELKVGYIRRISIDGKKFVEQSVCITHFDPTKVRFSLDPGYADHLLLGGDAPFDLNAEYKNAVRKRKALYKENDKIRVPTQTDDEINAFLDSLQPGDQLWYGWSRNTILKDPATVDKITADANTGIRHLKLVYSMNGRSYTYYHDRDNIKRNMWFKTRPKFLDEML